jgi:hypothetical protein
MTKGWAKAGILVSLALLAGRAEAGGPKKPETPFAIHVFTKSLEKDTLDSTADVRKAIREKKADWFRLTDDPKEADIVLEIVGRTYGTDTENVIRGRVSAATLTDADIVGQQIVSNQPIWKLSAGPWTNAARDMANRLEKYCRETYTALADAQRRRLKVGTPR